MRVFVFGLGSVTVVMAVLAVLGVTLLRSEPAPSLVDEAPPSAHVGSPDGEEDTSIDGRRPHLTVIHGHGVIPLPGSLAGVVSMLPGTEATLAPDTPSLADVAEDESAEPDHTATPADESDSKPR